MNIDTANEKTIGTNAAPIVTIRPLRGWSAIDFGELWKYRELLFYLTWREIKIRYKQTALGFAWAILQPFLMMVVFTLFFGNLAKVPSEGLPYPLFNYAALLPWTLFAEGITRSSNSLVQNTSLVQKIYFPRLALPIAGILSPLVDFAIALIILVGMMIYYGYHPLLQTLFLPAFLLLAVMTSLGVGLWLSAINVQYRDVRYVTPFLVQLWLFASPVVYSSSLLSERWQVVYGLNPMAGVIEGFRWSLLGTEPPGSLFVMSVIITVTLLVSGAYYFRRTERTFADVI